MIKKKVEYLLFVLFIAFPNSTFTRRAKHPFAVLIVSPLSFSSLSCNGPSLVEEVALFVIAWFYTTKTYNRRKFTLVPHIICDKLFSWIIEKAGITTSVEYYSIILLSSIQQVRLIFALSNAKLSTCRWEMYKKLKHSSAHC